MRQQLIISRLTIFMENMQGHIHAPQTAKLLLMGTICG
jgi:hypothetical protein